MVNDALELVYTLPRGDLKGGQRITEQRRKVPLIGATNVAFGGKTGTNHKVLCLSSAAVRCLDGPAALFGVEMGVCHHTFERRLALDVEDFVAVVEVVSELFVARVVVRPVVPISVSCEYSSNLGAC